MADVKIVMSGHGRGKVFIDGVKVPNVEAIAFDSSAVSKYPNRLTLILLPETVSIEGPADVIRPRLPWWKRLLGLTDRGHVPPARNPTPGSNPPAGYQPRPAPPPNPPPRKP